MIKKLFVFLLWLAGLIILALGCWVLGLYLNWPIWQSVTLFIGLLGIGWMIGILRRRWLAWRLRRRLARPAGSGGKTSLKQVDRDWQAGVRTLKRSRLSRFGSPLYVLPWFIALGQENSAKADLLRRASGGAPVHAESDEPPALRWWLLRNGVVLDPADGLSGDNDMPGSQYWRRLLHWMLHTRRREPLNGLIALLDAEWLTKGEDADLAETGRRLRKRLDELTRIYNVRMPVYIVLTHCEELPGFRAWADSLDPEIRVQPMGYLAAGAQQSASQFIAQAFGSIAQRMFDLRILQGMRSLPDEAAFGLPERLSLLADRLDKVMRPAFQATPYAETPLLHGLFLTARPANQHDSETGWFMPELFDRLLPGQRHAWKPIERWRHWRRLLRHAAAISWLVLCAAAAVVMIQGERVAGRQLQAIDWPAPDAFAGGLDSDLVALQHARDTILDFQSRRSWKTHWLPFQSRVDHVDHALRATYVSYFRSQIVQQQLDPLITTSLPLVSQENNDLLLAAWAQTLVRRINMINGALNKQDISGLPTPGPELAQIFQSTGKAAPSLIDIRLIGDLYRHYITWQTNPDDLIEKRNALRQSLDGLELPERSISWIYAWVRLQGYLAPVRMSDYWDITDAKGQPEIPAALTLPGERAVTAFLAQIGTASGDLDLWEQRHAVFEQHYLQASLQDWHTFAAAFPYAANRLPDANARRAVLTSLMGKNGPYRRLLDDLAAIGQRIPQDKQPDWMRQAIHLDNLQELAGNTKETGLAGAVQSAGIVNRLGADVVHNLPHGGSLPSGLSDLGNDQASLDDLKAVRAGLQATITPLLQGQGNAMQAAAQIWAFGHDPQIKSVPLIQASQALGSLRQKLDGTSDKLNTDPIWQLMQGPVDFTLDYAARSAGCGLQLAWEGSVLNAVQGVTDTGLINDLLYGERGQVTTFLNGPIKNFIDRGAVRYEPRQAMGRSIALNGQFYAFTNQAQLHQVGIMSDERNTSNAKAEIAALTQQSTTLEQQIGKLQATTASVTLSTVPAQVNPGARILPDSVTLTVQCAAKTLKLENLNFPNSAVFPWSLATCGDTVLTIQIDGLSLVKQWSGAESFIAFLREFSSGRHRYTPEDFPVQAKALKASGIEYIQLSYREQGQAPLVAAFNQADQLSAQLAQNQEKIAALSPAAGIGLAPAPAASTVHVPEQIISVCMGPIDTTAPIGRPALAAGGTQAAAPAGGRHAPAKPARSKPAAPVAQGSGSYSIQVGVFEQADIVKRRLEAQGYKIIEEPIAVGDKRYTSILIRGYASRQDADAAAADIGKLLHLEPVVIKRHDP